MLLSVARLNLDALHADTGAEHPLLNGFLLGFRRAMKKTGTS
jgi:hypothetical protein